MLFLSILFWGFTKAVELFLPLLIVVSYLLIIVFLFGFLPATFIKDLRPSLCVYSVMMSHALGFRHMDDVFFLCHQDLWILGDFLCFFISVFGTHCPCRGNAQRVLGILPGIYILWISFTYGMRFYSQWLLSLNSREQKKGDIIDVDAIEVEDTRLTYVKNHVKLFYNFR